jgi:hypothetical protein
MAVNYSGKMFCNIDPGFCSIDYTADTNVNIGVPAFMLDNAVTAKVTLLTRDSGVGDHIPSPLFSL